MPSSIHVFVIMPFSKTASHPEAYWTDHFEKFLKPLIEEVPNTTAERSKPLRGDLLRQIITELVSRPVVVADLTDANPNVYWELGVRQSFKHGTVTIAEIGTSIPFDVSMKAVLRYHPADHIQNAGFEGAFKAAISDCINNPEITDSQVLEAISGRGSLYEIIQREELVRRLAAVSSECTDNSAVLGRLRRLISDNEEGEKLIPTERFRVSATELLVTWRYLDRPQTFYNTAEKCLSFHIEMNAQLDVWESSKALTQNWVKGSLDDASSQISDLRQLVQKATKALKSSV